MCKLKSYILCFSACLQASWHIDTGGPIPSPSAGWNFTFNTSVLPCKQGRMLMKKVQSPLFAVWLLVSSSSALLCKQRYTLLLETRNRSVHKLICGLQRIGASLQAETHFSTECSKPSLYSPKSVPQAVQKPHRTQINSALQSFEGLTARIFSKEKTHPL